MRTLTIGSLLLAVATLQVWGISESRVSESDYGHPPRQSCSENKETCRQQFPDLKLKRLNEIQLLAPSGFDFKLQRGIHFPFWKYESEDYYVAICYSASCTLVGEYERQVEGYTEETKTIGGIQVTISKYKNPNPTVNARYVTIASFDYMDRTGKNLSITFGSREQDRNGLSNCVIESLTLKSRE